MKIADIEKAIDEGTLLAVSSVSVRSDPWTTPNALCAKPLKVRQLRRAVRGRGWRSTEMPDGVLVERTDMAGTKGQRRRVVSTRQCIGPWNEYVERGEKAAQRARQNRAEREARAQRLMAAQKVLGGYVAGAELCLDVDQAEKLAELLGAR